MFKFAVLSQFVALALAAIGPQADLFIGNANVAPDGFQRSAALAGTDANSMVFPGPVIQAFKGETFNINVRNRLADPSMLRTTSIHWHGFFQAGSAWADGPVGVTQCPIAPNRDFLYTFATARQAGTFWYHSHHRSQYCDGLRGAMVVYDPEDPHRSLYDVDNEDTIITLADWYHPPGPVLETLNVATANSTLINGKGRYPTGPTTPLAVVGVTAGKRYRFRLVSISCSPFFTFSIDGHRMTIIEADGESTQPLVVDSIDIHAGQRYSFVLEANQPVANYWIRSNPNRGNRGFAGGLNTAILRYVGAPDADPVKPSDVDVPVPALPLVETNLHPLENPAAPGPPALGGEGVTAIELQIGLQGREWTVNGATFHEPNEPILLQTLNGKQMNELLPNQGSLFPIPRNSVIELTMPGGGAGSPHPMQLHGHMFSVIRSASNSTPNFVNPVRRDVVSLGSNTADRVTVRFVTDNAGPWIMHCHIDWHLVHGLSVVFVEDIEGISDSQRVAEDHPWRQLCPIYEQEKPDNEP
uniref:Acidic laccase n=1 Tax=Ephemerocybe congregata TaxID=5347 RepID=Q9P8B9_EPHCO|nr:acidic laccase [Coprinellus congregatus]